MDCKSIGDMLMIQEKSYKPNGLTTLKNQYFAKKYMDKK